MLQPGIIYLRSDGERKPPGELHQHSVHKHIGSMVPEITAGKWLKSRSFYTIKSHYKLLSYILCARFCFGIAVAMPPQLWAVRPGLGPLVGAALFRKALNPL